jgi:hypothetical protein
MTKALYPAFFDSKSVTAITTNPLRLRSRVQKLVAKSQRLLTLSQVKQGKQLNRCRQEPSDHLP